MPSASCQYAADFQTLNQYFLQRPQFLKIRTRLFNNHMIGYRLVVM